MTEPLALGEIVKNESSGIIANRGIDGYAESFGMSRSEFLQWISSKHRILDIGAGGGMLKQEIDILKTNGQLSTNVEIVPFDISYATPHGLDNAEYATLLGYSRNKVKETLSNIHEVQRKFRKSATAGTFAALPFADNSFDGVLASFSFGVSVTDKRQLIDAFKETYRVLDKDTGSGKISVATKSDDMNTLGISNSPIQYTLSEIGYLNPVPHKTTIRMENEQPITAYFLDVKPNKL